MAREREKREREREEREKRERERKRERKRERERERPRSENLLSNRIWGIAGTFYGIRSLFHISAKKKAS